MDKRQRLALLGIAAVIAAVAIVIAVTSGGGGNGTGSTTTGTAAQTTADKPATPQPTVEKIEVKGGQPVGGLKKIKLKKGDQAEIDVTADTADQAHLHGYDIEKPLAPGKTVKFRFKATIEGVFEMELHHAGAKIARITVTP